MRIILDTPQSLESLRKLYNDRAVFYTTTKAYPLITELVVPGDYLSAMRKRLVPVRIGKRLDKLIAQYTKRLQRVWDKQTKQLETKLAANKLIGKVVDVDYEISKAANLRDDLASLKDSLKRMSKPMFRSAYQLGKERGQILTNQELNPDLTDEDLNQLDDKENWNEEHLGNLIDALYANYEVALERDYTSEEELATILEGASDKERYRLANFAGALGAGLLAIGMGQAVRDVQVIDETTGEPTGEVKQDPDTGLPIGELFEGGYWHTSHDERVCAGCEDNDGKWMTIEQFQDEANTNECLSNCRCIELFEPAQIPNDPGDMWEGTPGLEAGTLTGDIHKHLPGQHDQLDHAGQRGNFGHEGRPGQRGGSARGADHADSGSPAAGTTTTLEEPVTQVAPDHQEALREVLSSLPPATIKKFQEIRDKLKNGETTKSKYYDQATHQYKPERQALHNQIVESVMAGTTTSKEPTLIMTGGIPGSGKSSITSQKDLGNYVKIDSDAIKEKLPEYEGWNAALLQTEVDDIIGRTFVQAVKERKNILYDGTMKSYDKYNMIVDRFSNFNYKIGMWFADLPMKNALERSISRFQSTGRFVDPTYIATHNGHNAASYEKLKNEVDFYEKYNTNVPQGHPAKLEEQGHAPAPKR